MEYHKSAARILAIAPTKSATIIFPLLSDLTEVGNEMTWSCQISTHELSFAEKKTFNTKKRDFLEKYIIYFEYQSLKYIMNIMRLKHYKEPFFTLRIHIKIIKREGGGGGKMDCLFSKTRQQQSDLICLNILIKNEQRIFSSDEFSL